MDVISLRGAIAGLLIAFAAGDASTMERSVGDLHRLYDALESAVGDEPVAIDEFLIPAALVVRALVHQLRTHEDEETITALLQSAALVLHDPT